MSLILASARAVGLLEEELEAFPLASLVAMARSEARGRARVEIERVWPDWRQRNAALGVLAVEDLDACRAHIAAQRATENGLAAQIDAILAGAGTDAEKRAALLALAWPTEA